MSDQIEAAGAFATAGLAASALDQPASAHSSAHGSVQGGACANCAAALTGSFCGQCGQRAHLHRTVGAVFHEFLHGITHFDSKAWTTLPMLLFRPGKLIRSYIDGHRARYIAPVPLFLLVVFLMFFVFSFFNLADSFGGMAGGATKDGKQLTQAEAQAELPGAEAELAKLDAEIAAARKKGGDNYELPALFGVREGVKIARDQVAARAAGQVTNPANIPGTLAGELAAAEKNGKLSVNLGSEDWNRIARKALKNPELVLYKLQAKAYKLSFLLVPLSLPWLWLAFFWRRGVSMYDHAIFALYSISFISLLFIAVSLAVLAKITSNWFWTAAALAPAVHMFASLRGAYGIGVFGAAWRTAYLSVAAVTTLSLYVSILVVLGLLD